MVLRRRLHQLTHSASGTVDLLQKFTKRDVVVAAAAKQAKISSTRMSYLIAFFLIPMNPFVDKWETECDQGKHFKLVFTIFLAAANKLKVEYNKMHDELQGEDQDTAFLKFISASTDLKVHIMPFLNRMELVQDMMNSRRQLETDFDKCINAGNQKLAGTGVTMQTFFFLPFSVMFVRHPTAA